MYSGHRFIDSDAHILEPADMFQKYLEPKFRSQIPVAWADYQGSPLAFGFKLVVPSAKGGEYVMPFGADPLDAAVPPAGRGIRWMIVQVVIVSFRSSGASTDRHFSARLVRCKSGREFLRTTVTSVGWESGTCTTSCASSADEFR